MVGLLRNESNGRTDKRLQSKLIVIKIVLSTDTPADGTPTQQN